MNAREDQEEVQQNGEDVFREGSHSSPFEAQWAEMAKENFVRDEESCIRPLQMFCLVPAETFAC